VSEDDAHRDDTDNRSVVAVTPRAFGASFNGLRLA
jgi:hypothetical protein